MDFNWFVILKYSFFDWHIKEELNSINYGILKWFSVLFFFKCDNHIYNVSQSMYSDSQLYIQMTNILRDFYKIKKLGIGCNLDFTLCNLCKLYNKKWCWQGLNRRPLSWNVKPKLVGQTTNYLNKHTAEEDMLTFNRVFIATYI